MKTGIVMDLHDNEAVVLLSGGVFENIPRRSGWEIGDVVGVQPKVVVYTPVFSVLRAMAAVICLFFMLSSVVFAADLYGTTTALISMDVNPSFDLQINRYGVVMSVSTYNAEAKALMKDLKIVGKHYSDALDIVMDSPMLKNFLVNNRYVDFALYSIDGDQDMLHFLEDVSHNLNNNYPEITLKCDTVTGDLVNSAIINQMSVGKMSALLELKQLDQSIRFSDYNDVGIGEIHKQIETKKENIVEDNT